MVLIDIMKKLKNDILEYCRFDWTNDFDAYKDFFHITIKAVYDVESVVITNPILAKMFKKIKNMINLVAMIANRDLTGNNLCDTLKIALYKLRSITNKKYVIVCDALGFHDVLFILYKFHERPTEIFYGINPGGVTRTFEFIIKTCPALQHTIIRKEKITLADVKRAITSIIYGSGEEFRDIDNAIMKSPEFSNFDDIVNYLYQPVSILVNKIEKYLHTNNNVFIIADHGYDINLHKMKLEHCWKSDVFTLSILVPMVIIR